MFLHREKRIFVVPLLLICTLLVTACADSQNRNNEPTTEGSSNNSSEETAVSENPRFNEGLNNLLEGDTDAALSTFEALLDDSGEDELYGKVGIAAVHVANRDDDTSKEDLQRLLRELEGSNLPLGEALIHDSLGTLYLQQGAYADATTSIQMALALSEGANNSLWHASLAQNVGKAYAMQHINGLAYDYTLKAYNLYAAQNSPTNEVNALIQLGQIYTQLGLLEDAFTSYLNAEEALGNMDNAQLMASVLLGQGNIKAAQGQVGQALDHYQKALDSVQGESSVVEATIRLKLGQIQAQSGETKAANDNFALAMEIFTAQGDQVMVAAVEEAQSYIPTGEFNVNLVQNPGNEMELVNGAIPEWTVEAGLTNWQRGQEVAAAEGEAHFFVGAATEEIAELCQQIDVGSYALYIDSEKQTFELTLYTQVYPPSLFSSADSSQYLLEYYGQSEDELLNLFTSNEYQPVGRWEEIKQLITPPSGTRTIRLCLRSIKYGGIDSDGYFDDISLAALPPE